MKVFLLAAGEGTRLRPLTYQVPKPLVPVMDRPVLGHVLDNLKRQGVKDVVVNLHSQAGEIRSFCRGGSPWGMRITYSLERELMGTAGAVRKMASFFRGEPFFVLSGDGVSEIRLEEVMRFHKRKRALATMVLKAVDHRFQYGVTKTDAQCRIRGFYEKPSWGDVFSNTVNTGIYVYDPEVFRYIPSGRPYDFGHQLWPLLLKRKKSIFGFLFAGYWCDIGNLEEYRRCQRDALDGRVRLELGARQLRPGIWVGQGSRIHPEAVLKPPCLLSSLCRVGAGAVVGPHSVVGREARIMARAVVKNSILFPKVCVGKKVRLSNCIVGANGSVTDDAVDYVDAILMAKS
ncbi:MAG: NDP-sugar synthase [Elusimicrobia bacterium]|nr:NDP-sugar synthase [Elusimicrobiota bacterium]